MWITALAILYILVLVIVCFRIIMYTDTPSKGLAYLLLVITFPVVGVVFYLSVGLNYRKQKLYQKKIEIDENAFPELQQDIQNYAEQVLQNNKKALGEIFPLFKTDFIRNLVSDNNKVTLLINGEEKFPDLMQALHKAEHHIHIEYYIYEDDNIGKQIIDILIQKARQGVEVRFIYDDFGSRISKETILKMRQANIEAFPFYKINIIQFANRINYRNHRKIVVIDGNTGYVGGINVSDKYINNTQQNKLYWRDTHLKIQGGAALNLQFVFLTDWNFCANQQIAFSQKYFPEESLKSNFGKSIVQVIPSGPDSDYPNTMYSLIQAVMAAKKDLRITTPYFIPDKSFLDAVKIAALSGVNVCLLIPGISDSFIVNTTSQSYYEELLNAGVRIFKYEKGFVHAKTLVCDDTLSIVGTANLDNRSFDLNFEINAVVFDRELSTLLIAQYERDLLVAEEISISAWKQRAGYKKMIEKTLHLISPLM